MAVRTIDDAESVIASVMTDGKVTLGNVEFWIDADGPWAGRVAYSIPIARWEGVKEDLARLLTEKGVQS